MQLASAPGDTVLRAEFESWLSRSESHRRAYAAVEPVWDASTGLPPLTAARREASRAGRPWYRRPVSMMAGAALAACVALFALPALQLRRERRGAALAQGDAALAARLQAGIDSEWQRLAV